MNWLAGKLTAQVVQVIAGVLLALCLGLGALLWVQAKRLDVAVAERTSAESSRDAAITERDAWKSKAGDALAANKAYDVIFEQQRLAVAEQRRLAEQAAAKATAAVAAAQRDEAKAEQSLGEYRRIFGNKPKDCDAALLALDRVCPMIGGY